ncbi:MAG: BPSS1780 family membrane protein [Janthinobacterium lividum]
MNNLPARTGWQWIKRGFALFRKQPAELSTLFIGYMVMMFLCGVIPVLGQLLPLILVPVFSMAFMQACANIEQDKRVYPNLLLTGFRSPALKKLLILGSLYVVAALLAIGISSLVDGGLFWRLMTGRVTLTASTEAGASMGFAMLLAALLYIPAAMAFWFAAPLVTWHGMSLGRAMFYSFFAVRGAKKAFILFGLGWIALGIVLPVIISAVLAIVTGQQFLARLILLPISLLLTVVMYCSFYATYVELFGKQDPSRAS